MGIKLIILFLFAVVMGAGPGVFLINPDPVDPEAKRFILGIPIVYAWAVLWFGVQTVCVMVAYFKLWRDSPDPGTKEESS